MSVMLVLLVSASYAQETLSVSICRAHSMRVRNQGFTTSVCGVISYYPEPCLRIKDIL